ncbi:uncharacterized protein TRIADDRAFT_58932 [Trichoplax adhaerens]|uniref:Receptor ligand binding region domain-containing protein n=1 Tax=Trichoplax adhaerens TaxID=10228 RepID=B3S428_TRIAD|nr:predicted protein [Trichoplax adhaerens]EDV22568.1 predicted protein [Trichoplax adhaerens]|eukprot:XP_002115112.1 predicted protein [Trichoplax adhaerens]
MSDHTTYNTFVRTNGPLSQQADAFFAIMQNFAWGQFSLICNRAENRFIWSTLCELITEKSRLQNNRHNIASNKDYDLTMATDDQMTSLLQELQTNSRNCYLCDVVHPKNMDSIQTWSVYLVKIIYQVLHKLAN